MRIAFNKYFVIPVLALLVFASAVKIHWAASAPGFFAAPHPSWGSNWSNLKKLDKGMTDFSFAVFGDNKNATKTFDAVVDRLNQDDIAFSIDNGDLVVDGEMEKYRFFLGQVARLERPLLTAIGNHELYGNGRGNYYNLFGPFYYSFAIGDAYFIVLDDANQSRIDSWQMEWLKDELEKSRGFKYRFVFLHVPLYDPRPGAHHCLRDEEQAARLNDWFNRNDVTICFTSHIHAFYEGSWGDTPYVLTGTAGAEPAGDDPAHDFYHYVRVHVSPSGVSYEVVKVNPPGNRIINRYVYDSWVLFYAFISEHYPDLILLLALLYLLLFGLYALEKRRQRKVGVPAGSSGVAVEEQPGGGGTDDRVEPEENRPGGS